MNEYKKLRNLVIPTIRNSQRSYYKKTITANKSCDVWRAVNQSLGKNRKSSITSDLSPDAWNEHFASVGNKLCSKFSENYELICRNNSSIYKFKSLLKEDVLAFINKLPSETNVDILGYDSCILKLSSEIICISLTIVFNMLLYNGEIPNEWKKAQVTPVYKNKGSKQDPNNFRPISVIGHIPKLFEKLVDSQLREYLQSHSYITHSQSAFMKLFA